MGVMTDVVVLGVAGVDAVNSIEGGMDPIGYAGSVISVVSNGAQLATSISCEFKCEYRCHLMCQVKKLVNPERLLSCCQIADVNNIYRLPITRRRYLQRIRHAA